jgi:hypothetical protein
MSISISSGSFPNELTTKIIGFLDTRSKASCSVACKRFREIIKSTGVSLSMLGFTSYLTDELIASGLYQHVLASKSAEKSETFKSRLWDMWFKVLSREHHFSEGPLTSAISDLSSKRQWSDAKIQKLCRTLNYEAKKEICDSCTSWKVTLKI